jgi:hypothetical protein
MARALPLSELFSFTTGEMLALKRRGMLPGIADTIAEATMEDDPGPRYSGGRRLIRNCSTGAVFWGSDPPTEFETLVEKITRILNTWGGPESREKLEAMIWARRKCRVQVGSYCIDVEQVDFPWLSDRLESYATDNTIG